MDEWQGFFAATAGAAAALAGLLFVGVSINLSKILASPKLPTRAGQALLLLLTVLLVSLLMLVPAQPIRLVGGEVLLIGLVVWIAILVIDVRNSRKVEAGYGRVTVLQIALNQLSLVPYILAGFTILLYAPAGFYWLVPALLFSFMKVFLDSWVLLVEIDR
jgi:hypothetical protein